MRINKIILYIFVYLILSIKTSYASSFSEWKSNFKILALSKGISESTIDKVMNDARFLPKVIEYDRYQPEFYEDTFTYIKKRSSNRKIKEGIRLYKKEKSIIETVEKEFEVEKELLLALMGIETNFGKYLGKMDIISSLAT